MDIKGVLIPIGGNEDKGLNKSEEETLEYIQKGILSRVVYESGGVNASIVIVPTASSIPKEVMRTYERAFSDLGCTNIFPMSIQSRRDAEKPEFLEIMRNASCVMFSGGDQSKIKKIIGGTELDNIIKDKYINEHFVIAGTSAGAMCMSTDMITGGGLRDNFIKGTVMMGSGMGYTPYFIIDSHFIQRRRFGRLAEAVSRYPKIIGIGLAENTGLVIKNEIECEVIGTGMIILFDGRDITYNNQNEIETGRPMTLTNLETHILANGNRFLVQDGKIVFHLKEPELLTK